MQDVRPIECERTRQWVSAGLDCELSQFERALVASHVERCAACRSFESGVAVVTESLRAAPEEKLRSRIYLPARTRPAWRAPARLARIGSAAAVTAAAFVGLLSAPERPDVRNDHALIASSLAPPAGVGELVFDRASSLAQGKQQALAYGTGGIGAYKPPLPPTA